MRPYRDADVEAGCYFFGTREIERAKALTIGIPRQTNNPYNFHVEADDLADLVLRVPNNYVAVAQIHTHPGQATTHSPFDDDRAISQKIFSIVIPYYGAAPWLLENVGVHVFAGDWRKLNPKEVVARVILSDEDLNGDVSSRILDTR